MARMISRLCVGFGIAILAITFLAWWLLSGYGCEMNPGGCRTVRLNWSWDTVRLFLPGFALGGILVAFGSLRRH